MIAFRNWLRNRFAARPTAPITRARLGVSALEARDVPAAFGFSLDGIEFGGAVVASAPKEITIDYYRQTANGAVNGYLSLSDGVGTAAVSSPLSSTGQVNTNGATPTETSVKLVDGAYGVTVSAQGSGTALLSPKDDGLGVLDGTPLDGDINGDKATLGRNESLTIQLDGGDQAIGGSVRLLGVDQGEQVTVTLYLGDKQVGTKTFTQPVNSTESGKPFTVNLADVGVAGTFDRVVIGTTGASRVQFDTAKLSVIDKGAAAGAIALGQVGNNNQFKLTNTVDGTGNNNTVNVAQNGAFAGTGPISIAALDSADAKAFTDVTRWDQGEGLGIADGEDGNTAARKMIDGDEVLEVSLSGYFATSVGLDLAKLWNVADAAGTDGIYVTAFLNGSRVGVTQFISASELALRSIGGHAYGESQFSFGGAFFNSVQISATAPVTASS